MGTPFCFFNHLLKESNFCGNHFVSLLWQPVCFSGQQISLKKGSSLQGRKYLIYRQILSSKG